MSTSHRSEKPPRRQFIEIWTAASLPYNLMKFLANRFNKLTLLSAAVYIFLLAIVAKGIFLYGSQHPLKEDLIIVDGIVEKIRLGGNGKSTSFRIKSHRGTHVYSSYYGKVWPGMEHISIGDRIEVLAERNKLNRNEFISGKRYYIWELFHNGRYIVRYDDILYLVADKEKSANRYANGILAASAFLLLFAYIRKWYIGRGKNYKS
jgi:hypothetical protein